MGRKLQRPKIYTLKSDKPIRYVLYARKSSEGEDAQSQSLPDQIKYCREYASREGLLIVGRPIEESASAWTSNNRPKFNQILADIANGEYDGILSWHPDRLSRNMLESGMLMDMLDSGTIKDLKFPTVQFTNNAAGKLLLNILFAMSKNYTDSQSENVSRGVTSNVEQGKSSAYKWGYKRDEISGYYIPDENNFDLIKQGWHLRLGGSTQQEVVDFWKDKGVCRITKITRRNKHIRKIVVSKQIASNIFADPFYYGLLIQNNQEVDLRRITNFEPMISEETYNAVQAIGRAKARVPIYSKKKTFYPFRGIVLCGVCNGPIPMRVGKNRSANGTYSLTYRCDNKGCNRKPKSVRAKYILNHLYDTLDSLRLTDKEYTRYSNIIDKYTDERIVEIRTEKRSLEGKRNHIQSEIEKKSRALSELTSDIPKSVRSTLINDLEHLESARIDVQEGIDKLAKKIADPTQIKLSKEEFLNLVNSVGDKMRAGTSVEKDILARKLLLNITLDSEKTPSYLWREPFATMLKSRKINSGASEKT